MSARPAASTWSRARVLENGLGSAAGLRCARADGLGALGGEVRAGTGTEGPGIWCAEPEVCRVAGLWVSSHVSADAP